MNRQLRVAGLVLVLGLLLGLGSWQRQGKAAAHAGGGLHRLFSTAAASGGFGTAPRLATAPRLITAPVMVSTITVTSTGDGAANAANCPGTNCRLRDAIAKAVENYCHELLRLVR